MSTDPREAILGRLERERQQAEGRYDKALAALDGASTVPAAVRASLAAAEADLTRARQLWLKHAPGPADTGWRRALKSLFAEALRWLPWRRRTFHGAMMAATARNIETTRALLDSIQHFQSHVVWYAQAVSGHAGADRRLEASPESLAILHESLNALSDNWMKEHDALDAREARYREYVAAMTRDHQELREAIALAQHSTLAVKRAIESGTPGTPGTPGTAHAVDLGAFGYVTFEDRFRGSREEIRLRLADYVPIFAGATNVVDVGCGRGELLDLFREAGIDARGIDTNDEMVAACQARGLTADRIDAVAFLEAQPDASLGGLVAIQVVEHLEPASLSRMLELAYFRLRPGALLVLETINAACWAAYFDSYIRDLTHVRALHPDTLRHLVQLSGFSSVDVQYRAPIGEHDKLPTVRLVPPIGGASRDAAILDLVDTVNAHAERLNSQLFTYRDYAVIARR